MLRQIAAAGLSALLALAAAAPAAGQELRILSGAPSRALSVPMNRAVVVESDVPFAEVSIANPAIADISTLSERTIYVLGKTPGRTTMTLLAPDGGLIANVEVQVAPDIAEFKERLSQILPGETIAVHTANDGIVLSGTVSSISKLDRALELAQRYAPDRISNLMVVGGTQQVMLKVRFAEMQRSVSKRIASNFGLTGFGSDAGVSIGTGNANLQAGSGPGRPGSVRIGVDDGAAGQLGLGVTLGDASLSILLEALETKGVVRTLAEPNLTALSGQTAEFLAGGEYPIPVAQEEGVISIEFKPFGVGLSFVPRVVDGDIINLELAAEVSSLDAAGGITQNGFNIAGFRTRRASTTVEMRDGESFAIAGLLQDDFNDSASQVPFLGDVPILGALFRSAAYQRDQSELVVIITAHLVQPTRGEALALPTDRVRPPTERELFLFGRTEGAPRAGAAAEIARQDFGGAYGYVME